MAAQQDPPKQRCSDSQKALFAAAREGDVDGCRRLLSAGDVHANDVVHALSGGTALHAGIAHRAVVKLLIEDFRADVARNQQPPAAVDIALAGRGEECFLRLGAALLGRVLLGGHAARLKRSQLRRLACGDGCSKAGCVIEGGGEVTAAYACQTVRARA